MAPLPICLHIRSLIHTSPSCPLLSHYTCRQPWPTYFLQGRQKHVPFPLSGAFWALNWQQKPEAKGPGPGCGSSTCSVPHPCPSLPVCTVLFVLPLASGLQRTQRGLGYCEGDPWRETDAQRQLNQAWCAPPGLGPSSGTWLRNQWPKFVGVTQQFPGR